MTYVRFELDILQYTLFDYVVQVRKSGFDEQHLKFNAKELLFLI